MAPFTTRFTKKGRDHGNPGKDQEPSDQGITRVLSFQLQKTAPPTDLFQVAAIQRVGRDGFIADEHTMKNKIGSVMCPKETQVLCVTRFGDSQAVVML